MRVRSSHNHNLLSSIHISGLANRLPAVMLAAVILFGCCPCRQLQTLQRDTVAVIIRDSIYLHDTTLLWSPPDESSQTIADTSSHLETSLAESDAAIVDGRLIHAIRNRSESIVPINVTIPYRVHSESLESLSERTVAKEVPRELTWWQVFWIRLGQICAGCLLICVAVKLFIVKR